MISSLSDSLFFPAGLLKILLYSVAFFLFFISELCTFSRLFTYTHATITIQSVCFISGRSSMLYLLYCMLLAHCVLTLRRGAHCRVHSYHALEGSRGSVYRDHVFARWRGTCKPLKGRSSKIRVGSWCWPAAPGEIGKPFRKTQPCGLPTCVEKHIVASFGDWTRAL